MGPKSRVLYIENNLREESHGGRTIITSTQSLFNPGQIQREKAVIE